MQCNHKLLSKYDAVLCSEWKYLVLVEFDFATVVHGELLSSINANGGIGSNVSFVSSAKDSKLVTNFNRKVCVSWNACWESFSNSKFWSDNAHFTSSCLHIVDSLLLPWHCRLRWEESGFANTHEIGWNELFGPHGIIHNLNGELQCNILVHVRMLFSNLQEDSPQWFMMPFYWSKRIISFYTWFLKISSDFPRNALPWSTRLYMGNLMCKDTQQITNGSCTGFTAW